MINKQFAVVRFFDSTGLGKSTFHYAHDVHYVHYVHCPFHYFHSLEEFHVF